MALASYPGFPRARVEVVERGDAIYLTSAAPFAAGPPRLGDYLAYWAKAAPERLFVAERNAAGAWSGVTYAEALDRVERIGAALLEAGASAERPVMILSGNSVRHALLTLAAMHIGSPASPISVAYALLSEDLAKVRAIAAQLEPAIVYAENAKRFGRALAAVAEQGATPLVGEGQGVASLDEWMRGPKSAATAQAFARVGPEGVAKVLFTSGSTGAPKGVVNTHFMLTSNQEALAAALPCLGARPPVLVDWLPWNHTFGGNHNFNLVLRNGGTLYIDAGRPTPDGLANTLTNITDVAPTAAFNVPAGWALIAEALERDDALAGRFLERLDFMYYAAAALPAPTWEKLKALAIRLAGREIPFFTAYGATETAPLATLASYPSPDPTTIGAPIPGCTLKLARVGEKWEARIKGARVTPAYWRNPEGTAAAFDEEGYYRLGDAVTFDMRDPEQCLRFDGRVAENFKLASGTWVHVGALRVALIEALHPLVTDVVIAGHDREEIGVICFVASREGDAETQIAKGLARFNAEASGSSRRVARAVLADSRPTPI